MHELELEFCADFNSEVYFVRRLFIFFRNERFSTKKVIFNQIFCMKKTIKSLTKSFSIQRVVKRYFMIKFHNFMPILSFLK